MREGEVVGRRRLGVKTREWREERKEGEESKERIEMMDSGRRGGRMPLLPKKRIICKI